MSRDVPPSCRNPERTPGTAECELAAFLDCFREGDFYAAHDHLEPSWLQHRGSPTGEFLQGLIQLAGAMVHLQRHSLAAPRHGPARRLLRRARDRLAPFFPVHLGVPVDDLLAAAETWLGCSETDTPG